MIHHGLEVDQSLQAGEVRGHITGVTGTIDDQNIPDLSLEISLPTLPNREISTQEIQDHPLYHGHTTNRNLGVLDISLDPKHLHPIERETRSIVILILGHSLLKTREDLVHTTHTQDHLLFASRKVELGDILCLDHAPEVSLELATEIT